MGIYEQILNEDPTDAEAYWSRVLCRYGIEYVEDPTTHKRIPTVNRTQFTSIFDDADYQSALQYGDTRQQELYRQEAKAINEIQKGILAISQQEEPFDVFLCYKETDAAGRRTPDSVLAQEIYYELVNEGLKVFFSRITLEDKIGAAYEPYIFAALNSAKVMVVLGTKPEYFTAAWVKNEWSRYLSLIKNGAKKVLIPAYRDMDPYDLPEEFSHLQAQDMSKLGFMQDLLRGIQKIVSPETLEEQIRGSSVPQAAPLLRRAFLFLEDGDWKRADEYAEQVLNLQPENGEAYLVQLLVEQKLHHRSDLAEQETDFAGSNAYKKAMRFGSEELCSELQEARKQVSERYAAKVYRTTCQALEEGMNDSELYRMAAQQFRSIAWYKDSKKKMEMCQDKINFILKDNLLKQGIDEQKKDTLESLEKAVQIFRSIPKWRDADKRCQTCQNRIDKKRHDLDRKKENTENRKKRIEKVVVILSILSLIVVFACTIVKQVVIPNQKHDEAILMMNEGNIPGMVQAYWESGLYDNNDEILSVWRRFSFSNISAGWSHTVGIRENNTVCATGSFEDGQCGVFSMRDILSISAGKKHTVGLNKDGSVVAVGSNENGQCDVSDWYNIVGVSAGSYHTVGVEKEGTVVATGQNTNSQCNVSEWTDIVFCSAGENHTVGLKKDGTVVATGSNLFCQCETTDWDDIIAVSAGGNHTVGLKSDGTVVATGSNMFNQCNVSDWKDIVAISAGYRHTIGLKSDGTVVAVGCNLNGECNVWELQGIEEISAGYEHTVFLTSNGKVIAIGSNRFSQCDTSEWTDIKIP